MSNKETFLGKNFHEKKGQVTIFIIVGILIVIIAGGLIFVNRDKISFRGTTSVQVEPVREYLKDCVEEELKSLLPEMRRYGGYAVLNPFKNHQFDGFDFNLLNEYENGIFVSIENIRPEDTIKEMVIQKRTGDYCGVLGRFGLDLFQVYDREGDDIQVSISNNKILVIIDPPYRLGKGDSNTDIGSVNIEVENNFGRYYKIASEIIAIQNIQSNPADKINSLKYANSDLWFDHDTDGNKELFSILTNNEKLEYDLTRDENLVPFRFGIVTGG